MPSLGPLRRAVHDRLPGRDSPLFGGLADLVFRVRHRGRTSRDVWESSIDHELDFWRSYARREREHLLWRNDPAELGPLDRPFWDIVAGLPHEEVTVLDVGAGPITPLAKDLPGKRVTVTPVDALADQYARILAEEGIVPRVPTRQAHGEDLLDHFPPRSFHIAYSGNALDHAYDPVRVIRNMLAVTRDDGRVVLRHHPNEGVQALYRGLHQWNFDKRGPDLVVWNTEGETNVTEVLAPEAETETFLAVGDLWSVITPRPEARSPAS